MKRIRDFVLCMMVLMIILGLCNKMHCFGSKMYLEIGKTFVLPITSAEIKDSMRSTATIKTPAGNTGRITIPIPANEASCYLYKIKVINIDSFVFIHTISRSHH